MAIDDPKKRVTAPAEEPQPAVTLTFEQLKELLAQSGGRMDDDFLKRQAQYQAEANKRLLRPENEQHPGISVYRPHGRKDLSLKCKMFWVGYPLDVDTLTEQEIELLNRVEDVGEYAYTKTDGGTEKIAIEGEKDAHGKWTRLLFHFPCQGDNRHNQPSMVTLLREVLMRQSVAA